MPTLIRDAEGNEHQVFSQEEIDAKVREESEKAVQAAKTELEGKIAEKDGELGSLKTELETAREALDKADDGTKDWASMRKTIKELETKVETVSKEKEALKEEFSSEVRNVRTSIFQGTVDSMVTGLAGDDGEMAKKIKYHYERLGGEVKNEQEAAEKMKDAYLLATGKQAPNPLNVARGFSGEAPRVRETSSAEVAELGAKFGISDADITKYSSKAKEKQV